MIDLMKRLRIIVAIATVVALAACSAGSSKLRVNGTMTLGPNAVARADLLVAGHSTCVPSSGYQDAGAGAQVKVTSASGTLLATAELGAGQAITGPQGGIVCEFDFAVDVPKGESFYQFEVSHRGAVSFSADELKKQGNKVGLTLGM